MTTKEVIVRFKEGRALSLEEGLEIFKSWALTDLMFVANEIRHLLHPGNIAAFLTLMTVFSLLFPDFVSHKIFFISGIFAGSFLAFSLAGFLFWKIRKKADRYVHYLRYTLAVLLIFAGVCLVMCNFKTA